MHWTSYVATAALAGSLVWGSSPLAAAHSVTGQPALGLPGPLTLSPATLPAAGGLSALDADVGPDISRDGRQLRAFPAVGLVTGLAGSVLDAFLGVGAGEAVSAIFGSDAVPLNIAQLIDDALAEIDRIVGDQISEAFSNEKKTLLNSLGRQVREYTRRNNLAGSRAEVQDMLAAASDLISFFEENGVVSNAAFQTTLALRLSLLLELLQLDQLLGEAEATLEVVRGSIRAQARSGRATLEGWAATFRPTTDTVSARRVRPCGDRLPSGVCGGLSTRRTDLTVCMVLESPGLAKPDAFCRFQICRSSHTFGHIRRRRINRCLNNTEPGFRQQVLAHARSVGIAQFRERNEAAVFGEGFREFLADLASVEELEFADVSLPSVSAPDSE